ncbi:uncharacterized protein BJX67DRAFT_365881 [Aspergillus lucknowensis]|uniref:Uncharacterized protein n=1 Tax=Aspergillus lucknowensis TaxID=176173 RepID=A0ABR4LGW2_9EURO
MTTTSLNPPFVLRKAVLVSSYDRESEVLCSARLRIAHNEAANQGSISLIFGADLANLSSRLPLTFNVAPASIEECILARMSDEGLCSSHWLAVLPAPVNSLANVSTLSLKLGTHGIVLCPFGTDPLIPTDRNDSNFRAFAKICKSKSFHLHFSKRQFVPGELEKLEKFSYALQKGNLQAEPFNPSRQRVVETDWRVFSLLLDPPPYYEDPVSGQAKQVDPPLYREEARSVQGAGKRVRDQWSPPLDYERQKRLCPPSPQLLSSPTEIKTPTTLSPSPSIRPTHFKHACSPGHMDCDRLARLEHELRDISDDLLCKLLIKIGREHLLAVPGDVDRSGVPIESEKIGLSNFDLVKRNLIQDLEKTIKQRLDDHFEIFVNRAVSECRDQILDEYQSNEAEFREQVEDGNSELRITTDECMKEINEQAQKHMHEIEEQAQKQMHEMEEQALQCMNDIENRGVETELAAAENIAKSKRWLNTSAQSLPDSRSSLDHELDIHSRRNSI